VNAHRDRTVAMMSRSRTLLAVAATALGVLAFGACALAGARSPDRPTPSLSACDQALTVGHVPGHLDRVWQLVCDGETADSGRTDRPTSPPSTTQHLRSRPGAPPVSPTGRLSAGDTSRDSQNTRRRHMGDECRPTVYSSVTCPAGSARPSSRAARPHPTATSTARPTLVAGAIP
jgi:hypothetical protein